MKPPSLSELLRATITLGIFALVLKLLALNASGGRAMGFNTGVNALIFGIAGTWVVALVLYLTKNRL